MRMGTRRIRFAPLAACALLLGLAACGHDHDDYRGNIYVDNQTHTGQAPTNEDLLTFRIARFGDPFTGDLLGGALEEDAARFIGTFDEDYYDAEGDLELGQVIEWFDVFVGEEEDTWFVVE